jgi:hypothetical protein
LAEEVNVTALGVEPGANGRGAAWPLAAPNPILTVIARTQTRCEGFASENLCFWNLTIRLGLPVQEVSRRRVVCVLWITDAIEAASPFPAERASRLMAARWKRTKNYCLIVEPPPEIDIEGYCLINVLLST